MTTELTIEAQEKLIQHFGTDDLESRLQNHILGLGNAIGFFEDLGKYVSIHSCGDVDELFNDLIDIGLDCFNPFQPEVMDVAALIPQYRGRRAFIDETLGQPGSPGQ